MACLVGRQLQMDGDAREAFPCQVGLPRRQRPTSMPGDSMESQAIYCFFRQNFSFWYLRLRVPLSTSMADKRLSES